MSRVGKVPIPLASGVEVEVADGIVKVKGPKGALEQRVVPHTSIEVGGDAAVVQRDGDSKTARSMHGLMRSLLANMVHGVTGGFTKQLEIQGVGYRAAASGKTLNLLLGLSHPVDIPVPEGLSVSVQENIIKVEGTSRQAVGQFAAEIRKQRPPEPYKGKGIRYVGERVRRKVGKAAVA